MKIALIQMRVSSDKQLNIETAIDWIGEAADKGARMVILPEMFNCPYENRRFHVFAEEEGGETCQALSRAAAANKIFIVGGSIPERRFNSDYIMKDDHSHSNKGDISLCGMTDEESVPKDIKLYNTCFIYDDHGKQISWYSKAHLFDISIEGGQHFKESRTFTPGNDICLFEADGHRFAVAICFDIRFADYFRRLTMEGAEAIIVPAAFNMTTGPMHWELAFRSRAVDNQLYTIGVAPARDESGKYVSYANSLVCDPWGQVVVNAGRDEGIVYADLDFDLVTSVRTQLPILSVRREELY